MTHVLPQKEVVQAARAQEVEHLRRTSYKMVREKMLSHLSEYLTDYLRIKSMFLQDQVELGELLQQGVQRLLGVEMAWGVKVGPCAACSAPHGPGLVP